MSWRPWRNLSINKSEQAILHRAAEQPFPFSNVVLSAIWTEHSSHNTHKYIVELFPPFVQSLMMSTWWCARERPALKRRTIDLMVSKTPKTLDICTYVAEIWSLSSHTCSQMAIYGCVSRSKLFLETSSGKALVEVIIRRFLRHMSWYSFRPLTWMSNRWQSTARPLARPSSDIARALKRKQFLGYSIDTYGQSICSTVEWNRAGHLFENEKEDMDRVRYASCVGSLSIWKNNSNSNANWYHIDPWFENATLPPRNAILKDK